MAHLWMSLEEQWRPVALTGDGYTFKRAAPDGLEARPADAGASTAVVLWRAGEGAEARWVLFVPPSAAARVNGYPISLGMRVLRDRDEIRLPGDAPVYFSTEELTSVETFPGSEAVMCPRCASPLDAGLPAVRCPSCGVWYHQSPERSCFTYAEVCTTCGAETALNEEFRWSPEEL